MMPHDFDMQSHDYNHTLHHITTTTHYITSLQPHTTYHTIVTTLCILLDGTTLLSLNYDATRLCHAITPLQPHTTYHITVTTQKSPIHIHYIMLPPYFHRTIMPHDFDTTSHDYNYTLHTT